MSQLINSLSLASNHLLQALCLITAWSIIFFFVWSSWSAAKQGIATVKRLHQVPCSNCRFFTGDYHLKCPVHPTIALTEEAITCLDYLPNGSEVRY